MAFTTTCPHCRASFRLADELRGKRVRCKSCQEPFVLRPDEEDADTPPARERIRSERPSPVPPPPLPPRRRRDETDETDDSPRRPDSRRSADRSRSGGALLGLIVGGLAALGVLVLGGMGAAAWWLLTPAAPAPKPIEAQVAAANPAPAEKTAQPAKPAPQVNPMPPANPPAKAEQPERQHKRPVQPANPAPANPAPPMNPPKVAAAPAPAPPLAPAGLRYRWDGAPHVYRVRTEVDRGDTIEVQDGACLVYVKPGNRSVVAAEERKGTGTGFVVNANGYLVTCAHVVADAKTVEVALGGKTYPAKVVSVDHDHDLALIQIDARGLAVLPLADSNAAQIGQEVRALGFPLSSELGESLKATRGTISGINATKTKKTFQIDAALNPGNSGGPLVSETGEVLGVNSAKLTGEAVSNIGIVTPSNQVKELLKSKSVSFTKGGGGAKLDGPTLIRKMTPAVALITATVAPDVTAETYQLTCSTGLFKKQPLKPGEKAAPGPLSFPGTTTAGTLHVDARGQVLEAKGSSGQLPSLMGEIGQFLIDPLPPDSRPNWEFSGSVTIGEKQQARGPWPGLRSHAPGYRGPAPKNVRVATEHTTFRRGQTADHLLTLHKHYELKALAAGTSPALKMVGNGEIRFDTQAGMPRSIEYKATLTLTSKNASARIPMKVTYTLLEGAEKEKILHPPPPPPPKAYTDAEMLDLLAGLRGADENKKWAAVDKLGKAKVSTRRDEVARALDPLLKDTNFWHRGSCLAAIAVWGTKVNVPSLLPLLEDKDGWRRVAVVKILGDLKDERAVEPIAKMLGNWFGRGEASQALQKIGSSKAEKVILPFLTHADAGVRTEACKILGVIGTKESKASLEKATSDRNPFVSGEAKKALAQLAKRL